MTPDKFDYLPCKTCGILEHKEHPHEIEWCAKAIRARLEVSVKAFAAPREPLK
jgi:hypothetical protein